MGPGLTGPSQARSVTSARRMGTPAFHQHGIDTGSVGAHGRTRVDRYSRHRMASRHEMKSCHQWADSFFWKAFWNVPLLFLGSSCSFRKVAMREVISIHLGQCGVQIGNACWELYCLVRPRARSRTHRARPSCAPALTCPIRARFFAFPASALRAPPHCHAHAHRSGLFLMPCTSPYPNLPSQRASAPRPPLRLPLTVSCNAPSYVSFALPCLIPTGARHPARWPNALGQDHWRRR